MSSDPNAHPSVIDRAWQERLRRLTLGAGMVLILAALFPVAIEGSEPRFLWQTAHGADQVVLLVLVLGTGLGALVLGSITVDLTGRALAALVLGLPALAFQTVVMGLDAHGSPTWQVVLTVVGLTMVATGALTRESYWGSLLARLVCTIGMAMTVVAHAAPADGGPSRIGAAIETARAAEGLVHGLWIAAALPLLAGLGGLLAWLPANGPASGDRVARLAIAAVPLAAIIDQATRAAMYGHEPLLADLFHQLTAPLILAAWLALTAHGGAWPLRQAETAA